jgi:ERCC4-type nuclease
MSDNTITLKVDCREQKVISELDLRDYSYIKVPLVIGDFVITKDDIPMYVIERKSIPDLISSITDNRFREQKVRLEETYNDTDTSIVYIIEEYQKMYTKTRIPKSTLESAIVNLSIIHNFKVFYSKDYKNTTDLILMLCKKLESSKEKINEYTYIPVHTVKKSDVFYTNTLACQLSVIPGISWSTALVIQENYKTMNELVTKFDIKGISEIQVGKRKFGNVLAKRLQDCLGLNITELP